MLVNISRLGRRLVRCEAGSEVVRGGEDGGDRGGGAIAGVSSVVVV